jgi:hypothetical protein
MAKSDPRSDKSGQSHKTPEVGKSKTYPAPGGAGTGTKGDPAPAGKKKGGK